MTGSPHKDIISFVVTKGALLHQEKIGPPTGGALIGSHEHSRNLVGPQNGASDESLRKSASRERQIAEVLAAERKLYRLCQKASSADNDPLMRCSMASRSKANPWPLEPIAERAKIPSTPQSKEEDRRAILSSRTCQANGVPFFHTGTRSSPRITHGLSAAFPSRLGRVHFVATS